jgi:hypothetical protein
MNRARFAVAAMVGVSLLGGTAWAQAVKAPDLKPILAGKKFTPPFKGQANIEIKQPVTKRVKDMVVTKIEVKNMEDAPIARLTVDETWYDKAGNIVAGGKGLINGLLQPGEVQTLEIETPYNPKMNANNWNFTHVNGTVKPKKVKTFTGEEPEKPEAKKKK